MMSPKSKEDMIEEKTKENQKKKIALFACLGILLVVVLIVVGCFTNWFGLSGGKNTEDENAKQSSSVEQDEAVDSESAEDSDVQQDQIEDLITTGDSTDSSAQSDDSFNGGKYMGIETYTNENGNKAAQTDKGVEVEITSENFEQLMTEYMAISETDPERAEELLDQIQIFFDNVNDPGFIVE